MAFVRRRLYVTLYALTWIGVVHALTPQYNYIIVGGGTSGLVLANRLSELPYISVAVIEPGSDERSNPNVTDVNNFPAALKTPIDWQYRSTPQVHVSGQVVDYPAGKAIGGTSTING